MNNREIDRLVAEKVMGWTHLPNQAEFWYPPGVHPLSNIYGHTVPSYSTSISDAWLVVERMREMGYNFHASVSAEGSKVAATFLASNDPLPVSRWTLDSMPMSICLAALRSLGVEVSA